MPTKKINSSDRTEINLVKDSDKHKLMKATPSLNENMFTANFSLLKRAAPYAVSVKGIAGSLQQESFSRDGNAMRSFKLHDNTGKCISCVAYGRQASSSALIVNSEIIIFFAQALPANQNNMGALWIFDTAHIVKLRQNCKIPQLQDMITLKE